MQSEEQFQLFKDNPFIKSIAGNTYWTIVDDTKMPIDFHTLRAEKRIIGAYQKDATCLTTLDDLHDLELQKQIRLVNYTYALDALIDGYVVLDVEPTCPWDLKLRFLRLPYLYGELSMSGKGLHLVFPLPDCIRKYPAAAQKPAIKGEQKFYEILIDHYVSFTRNPIPQEWRQEAAKTAPDKPEPSFKELFEKLAAAQREVITKPLVLTPIEDMDVPFLPNVLEQIDYVSGLWLKRKTVSDYDNDQSRFEFAFLSKTYTELLKLVKVNHIKQAHTYTDSELAWILATVFKKHMPHRDKHDEPRGMNGTWLQYIIKTAMELINADQEAKKQESRKNSKKEGTT